MRNPLLSTVSRNALSGKGAHCGRHKGVYNMLEASTVTSRSVRHEATRYERNKRRRETRLRISFRRHRRRVMGTMASARKLLWALLGSTVVLLLTNTGVCAQISPRDEQALSQ